MTSLGFLPRLSSARAGPFFPLTFAREEEEQRKAERRGERNNEGEEGRYPSCVVLAESSTPPSQLGAEVSRCVWHATVSGVASRPT